MTTPTPLPDLVIGTASMVTVASCLMAVGVTTPHATEVLGAFAYCLDAPEYAPAGAMAYATAAPRPLLDVLRA